MSYDFAYYLSAELNSREDALVLVSRDGIARFSDYYADCIEADYSSSKIVIKKKEEALACFRMHYEENGKKFADVFDYAFKRIMCEDIPRDVSMV